MTERANFSRDRSRIPDIYLTGSVAAAEDVTGNGLPDLFVGARAVPWGYGQKPESYLLINQGEGYFEVDESVFGRRFSDLGLVTGAQWADMNGDGNKDLVISSEWEGIKIVYHDENRGTETIPNSSGLWNTVAVADLNNNGRPDILAGNLGLNSKFRASNSRPLRMYVNDFDGNGITEQIVTVYDNEGTERLFARYEELAEQLPYIGERFETHNEFAEADLYEIVDRTLMNEAITYEVHDLSSAVFYQNENGFHRKPLPLTSQFAPVHTFLVNDLTGNGYPDVVTAGNFFDANIQRGRYAADYGNVLLNDREGNLHYLPNRYTDWFLTGPIKKLDIIQINEEPVMVVAENDQPLRFFRVHSVSPDVIPLLIAGYEY
jgi:enediyne biosynthesis protein E4